MNIVMNGALREVVLGLWKVHILHHAGEGGTVGNHLLVELRHHGYNLSPGTLYPLLHRMERNRWLTSTCDDGPRSPRRYSLTPVGAEALDHIRGYVDQLFQELHERDSVPRSRTKKRSREVPQRRRVNRGGTP